MKSLFSHTFIQSHKRGFTLLLAALVSSIALSLGAAIFSLAQKEVILASLSKSSQFAFYAADTASECALYWDIRYSYFATSTPPGVTPTCDGTTLAISSALPTYPYTQNFEFEPNGYCADVAVTKSIDPVSGALKTLIHADGYSTPCATKLTSDQALQRSVELNY